MVQNIQNQMFLAYNRISIFPKKCITYLPQCMESVAKNVVVEVDKLGLLLRLTLFEWLNQFGVKSKVSFKV